MVRQFVTYCFVIFFLMAGSCLAAGQARTEESDQGADHDFRVTLLGTGTPIPTIGAFGPSTLVEAGTQKLLIDVGRGAAQRLWQLKIPLGRIDAVFITHWHSDHTVGFPDLLQTGWLSPPYGRRSDPLRLYGPKGVKKFSRSVESAWATDRAIRVKDEHMNEDGALIDATEYQAGVVYNKAGVKVTAITVDHGKFIKPAFGFRIDYGGRTAVISGDTRFSENLIQHALGADLLIHEVASADPQVLADSSQVQRIIAHHTTPEEAGTVFSRVHPALAAFTHIVRVPPHRPSIKSIVAGAKKTYNGRLVAGRDLMAFDVGKGHVEVIDPGANVNETKR